MRLSSIDDVLTSLLWRRRQPAVTFRTIPAQITVMPLLISHKVRQPQASKISAPAISMTENPTGT